MYFSFNIKMIPVLAGIFIFPLLLPAQKAPLGHWVVVSGDPYELKAGDTLMLQKRKQTPKMYEWGSGVQSGFEFLKDGSFNEYHNVLCSTESNPVVHAGEKWSSCNRNDLSCIEITGPGRKIKFGVVTLTSKKLVLVKAP